MQNCDKLERHGRQLCKTTIKLSLGKQRVTPSLFNYSQTVARRHSSHIGEGRFRRSIELVWRVAALLGQIPGPQGPARPRAPAWPRGSGCNANLIWVVANKCSRYPPRVLQQFIACKTVSNRRNCWMTPLYALIEFVVRLNFSFALVPLLMGFVYCYCGLRV